MDNTVDMVKEMVSQLKEINEMAYNQHGPIASDLCSRIATLDGVEHTPDRMMVIVRMVN